MQSISWCSKNAKLKQEVEFLSKVSLGSNRQCNRVVDCCEFVEAEKATFSIAMMCRVLQVSWASFDRWRQPRQPSAQQVRHQQLVEAFTTVFEDAEGMAGRRQLTRMLHSKGVEVSEPTVGSIMHAQNLRAIRTAAWKQTTVQDQ